MINRFGTDRNISSVHSYCGISYIGFLIPGIGSLTYFGKTFQNQYSKGDKFNPFVHKNTPVICLNITESDYRSVGVGSQFLTL